MRGATPPTTHNSVFVDEVFSCVLLHQVYCICLSDCTITKFLNRILGLEVHKQNYLFQYFTDNFDYLIEKDKKEGKYDMGILGKDVNSNTSTLSAHYLLFPRGLIRKTHGTTPVTGILGIELSDKVPNPLMSHPFILPVAIHSIFLTCHAIVFNTVQHHYYYDCDCIINHLLQSPVVCLPRCMR